ncbi:MAG: FAD-dependent oxidoreductase [Bacteroidetes bacterium]|nr:FAD-dependent oxidoreductase [Bacteroidota bacterium]
MKKILILLLLVVILIAWFLLPAEMRNQLSLAGVQANLQTWSRWVDQNLIVAIISFGLIYAVSVAFSLPVATILTISSGALFGFWIGMPLVVVSASVGGLIAAWMARTVLRDWVIRKAGSRLTAFDEGVKKDGAFYLFALRLVPVFPFFLVNLVSGLSAIPLRTIFWVTALGIIPGTSAYVFAGLQISHLSSLSGILSPGMLVAFTILGITPLISKKILTGIQSRKVYNRFKKPKQFDYNQIVIGAGAGGLVTAYIGATVGAKVALIERHKMGGDCLNYGCVPSKALIHAARLVHDAGKVSEFGSNAVSVDTAKVIERVKRVIKAIEPHDSVERYTGLGVTVIRGDARLVDPWTVEVNGTKLTARTIVLATGAEPLVPPFPGLDRVSWVTSDTLWNLDELPAHLVMLGGGPIGVELSQALNRLGTRVTIVEMASQIMGREDRDVADLIRNKLQSEGIQILTGRKALRFEKTAGDQSVLIHAAASGEPDEQSLAFDTVMLALGRKSRQGFGMAELGIALRKNGTIEANDLMQTNFPNIYVAGDATGPYQFTHVAAHQAWYAAVNGLFSPFWSFKADYRVIPWVTFTDPQVARVGLSLTSAAESGISVEETTYHFDDLDRAIADGETAGFIRVLTPPGKDSILGVTIVGDQAGELLAEWVLAMKHGIGLNQILGTIHAYPTKAESAKYVAGAWKRAHKPEKLLKWTKWFFELSVKS